MYHLLYVSSAVNLFSERQLEELLEVSRHNNSACGITGLLLYVSGNFIQLLEGEKELVQATHQRIAGDPRHRGLITLLEGDCAKREFRDWSMGFKKVDRAEGEKAPGYSEFLQTGSDPAVQRTAAIKLFEYFRKNNR